MIRLTREVRFSVDRDWAGHIREGETPTNAWGGWPSAVGVVPFVCLRATVSGEPHEQTGYVCNISMLDEAMRGHAIPFVAEELRRHGWRMSGERLVWSLWSALAKCVPEATTLERLELRLTPSLRYEIDRENSQMVYLTQQFEFSAAHRLHCPELDTAENRRIFGKCNNPNGHGHNYVVDVTVAAVPDGPRGTVLPLPLFEQTVREHVIDVFDHKHLNLDTPQFTHRNPSVENIARTIWAMLADQVSPARLHCVRVYETPKTWADYFGA